MTGEPNTMSQDEEYDSILGAVMETARGRWFVEEFTRRNRTADTNELLDAINTLKSSASGSTPETIDVLRRELQEMSASIQQTRSEITAIKPDESEDNRIMAATEELDAILIATERATSEILTGAERIQEISEKLREQKADEDLCDELESHATGIFMACSFQDITGQRTTKVVQVLQYLEHRIDSMIQIWGISSDENTDGPAAAKLNNPSETRPDAHLLNGPQSEAEAPSQDEIDDIFVESADDLIDEVESESAECTDQAEETPEVEQSAETALPADQAADQVNLDDLQFAEILPNEITEQNDVDALFD
ncbi:MAG: protein phosphatase CheZ [Rhodobiaceae bacterium]|nr:protein phosphatase CheZ [Rhodobiaceae bacterium]